MRIVYICKYSIIPRFGPPTRQYFISKYLSRQPGNDVLLIGSRSTLASVPAFKGLSESVNDGHLEMATLNGPAIGAGLNLKRLWSWVLFEINIFRFRKNIQKFKPDIVIVSSLSILTFLSGVFLKKWLNIPLVIEIRDIYPLTLLEVGNYSRYHPAVLLLKLVEKYGYKNADLIVSTLPNAAEHIRTVIKKPFDFYWLPMGVDLDFYSQAKQPSAPIVIEKKAGEFIVGYAGSMGTANALEPVFEAAASLQHTYPGIKFVFIGDGPLKNNFSEKYGLLPNVVFLPAVSKTSLQSVLTQTDLLINTWLDIPIYRFGISPNKWMDYMYAEKPILVAMNGYKCIIDEARCGMFIPANDKKALIEAMVKFSKMPPEELTSLGKNGKDYLVSHLSYETLSVDFYKKLLSIKAIK